MRTLLFGLDGATYTVLDPLVASGLMPNLARVYREGARAKLLSTPMPLTPQAWTSMATGRGMGHHGIHDFVRLESRPEGFHLRFNSGRDIACETIWKYASRMGKRITALNWIYLSPPSPVNGHTMPGFVPGRYLRRSSYPADLFQRLQQIPDFDVNLLGMDLEMEKLALQDLAADQWLAWINHHIERERVWFGILEHLMLNEPSDLSAIVFDGVDKLQHLAYRFLDPQLAPKQPTAWEKEIDAACRRYFQEVDRKLGRAMEILGKWGRVFIASDHGFTATHEIVHINRWLHDQGYLRWLGEAPSGEAESIFVEGISKHFDFIDRAATKAFALTASCNGIYIINVSPDEYAAFRDELIRKLSELRGPDGGRVITDIKKREEWFPGPFMQRAPDLTIELRDFGFVSVLDGPEVVVPRKHIGGVHHPDGVLLGCGPGIREGVTVERRNILDVAPLLCHSIGLEIPAEYEGEFPVSLYDASYLMSDAPRKAGQATAAATPSSSPVAEDDLDEEDEALLMERLKSLGYVE